MAGPRDDLKEELKNPEFVKEWIRSCKKRIWKDFI